MKAPVLIALLVVACAVDSGTKDSAEASRVSTASPFPGPPSIPRSVRVNTGTIALGDPLAPAVATRRDGDTISVLGAGAIAGAERVYVHLTSAGIVKAVIIDYSHAANFYSILDEHAVTLGAPERSTPTRRGEEPAEVAVWRDAQTELRLVRDPNRSAWTVRSELVDRTTGSPR